MATILRRWIRAAAPIIASVLLPISTGWACYPCCCIIDGHTRYMWARTWYGPNALATPLNDYFIPRCPDNCCGNASGYGHGGSQSGEMNSGPTMYGSYPYSVAANGSFYPVQFEHLGKIPNELEAAGFGMPAGAPAPVSVPRR